jgi:hypothetical protein
MGEAESEIDKYIKAVSERKSINRKHATVQVNYAVVTQLEDKDIPLLLEMLKVSVRALESVISIQEDIDNGEKQCLTHEPEEEMAIICATAYVKTTELAQMGSKAKWGGVDTNVH